MLPPDDTLSFPLRRALLVLTPLMMLAACHVETPELANRRDATSAAEVSATPPQPPQPSIDPPVSRSRVTVPGSDGTLVAMVESALLAEPALQQAAIDVTAVDGTVYLRGKAQNRGTRRLATQVASTVDGVKRVQNELLVVSGS